MIETALQELLQRHGLSRSSIRFWVVHPGGRKVIDNVQTFRHDRCAAAFLPSCIAQLWKHVIPDGVWMKWCVTAIRERETGELWSHWDQEWLRKSHCSDGSSPIGLLAACQGTPSCTENGLVGGVEVASERSIIFRRICGNERRKPLPARFVPDGNWLLGVPGGLRRRQARHRGLLKDGPQSCVALAAVTGADAPSIFRLMRALSSVGIFFASPGRLLCCFPPCGKPSDRRPRVSQGDGDHDW